MKNYIKLICLSALIIFSNRLAEANRIRSESSTQFTSQERNAQNTQHTNSDSLPSGVTKEWLNSLTDETGKKIIHPEAEGDAMQERFFTGFASSDQFGNSISSAGDVNGDGFDDIIIGAPLNDAGGTNAGRAYIFFGGNLINSGVDVILTGLTAGDQFGISVSTSGDVNGDGYSDVIVGANFNDAGGSNAGRAYVYFGGSSMNNAADIILTGAAASDLFGTSVSAGGDMNGDGYSDVIVGASFNDAGGSNAGRAYIYYGANSPDNTADVILTGAAASDQFGNSVSSSGDLNGDGFSDVIVGAYLNDAGGTDAGRAYIFFGGSSPDNSADVMLTGATTNDQFGISVSAAGDVNGDGYSDVISGAFLNSAGGSNAGRAYVYFGGNVMDSTADVIFTGETAGDAFGWKVSAAGDMNGDGYSDVISAADLNDAGGLNAGRVYIYFNSMTGTDIADEFFTGAAANDFFGYSVSAAGDMNGDGFNDIIVGAPYNNAGGSAAGRTYIYFGGVILNNTADVILTGKVSSELFGYSVSAAGDVNSDGYSDVIISGVGNNALGIYTGRAYVFFGGSIVDTVADVIMTGAASGDQFGYSVSSAGDVNSDGYSDVIIGANLNDSAGLSSGRAYVYLGGSTMNNVADVTITGAAAGDQLGRSVSSAGDINGDGYSDVIVGEWLNDAGGSNAGQAQIFFGGISMNNAADVTYTGATAGDQFGQSVSSAGDVNGDGYSDVIIGAPNNDAGGSNAGRSYIYYGGIIPDAVPDVTLTGTMAGDNFGFAVNTAEDVNGDGYDDVIVGTPYDITGGNDAGRVYVYFGGLNADTGADVIMSGADPNDLFGYSVSPAGDMNGDGYSDIIAGAIGNDAGGSSAGRAYLYMSSAPPVKPIFNTLKDVPNDQGGQVYLKWARSGYDVRGINKIISYSVLRSFPPVNGNFSWQTVSEINAEQIQSYSFTDHTPVDSASNNSGTFFYRIKAKTSNISEYWYSGILSGRSIDNIAPLMVSPFTAAPAVNNVLLQWNRNSSPDLLNYVLYRSTSQSIDPETEPVFATTTDSAFLDTAPLSGVYYYFIIAQDIHNNKSPVAVAESPNITLNMTMFIEGFYNSVSNLQISDTIKVYLRSIFSPFAKVDSAEAVVYSNGSASLLFGNAPTGQYYIVITHRNSIETWSKPGGESLVIGASAIYNFSNASSQSFGNNIKQVDTSPVRFAAYSGDVNQDGFINLTDIISTYNDAAVFVTGYNVTDLNGDNISDLTDVIIANNNSNSLVSRIRP